MIGHHAVVHVHREQRQGDGEQVDHERRQQHVAVQRRVVSQRAPEPVAMLDAADFRGARIEAELGPRQDRVAGIAGHQFVAGQQGFRFTQFGKDQAGGPAVVLPAQQHAGFLAVEQQHGGKQGGIERVERFLHHIAGEAGPFGGAAEQRRREAVVDQRQPVDGRLTAQGAAVRLHHHEQTFE